MLVYDKTLDVNDEYRTPPKLISHLEKTLGIRFSEKDPCPMGGTGNGLEGPWGSKGEWVFCNPPFSKTADFVRKASRESRENGVNVAMLISARPNNTTWQNHVLPEAKKIYFIRTGFKFLMPDGTPAKQGAPQALAIVIFGNVRFDEKIDIWDWRIHGV